MGPTIDKVYADAYQPYAENRIAFEEALKRGESLLTVLAVGLVVSIVQAATQIHEATLSFVPKIVAAVAVLAVAGPWMLTSLVEFLQRTLQSIPSVVG